MCMLIVMSTLLVMYFVLFIEILFADFGWASAGEGVVRFLDHNYWSRIFRCRYLFARIDGLHPACIQLEAKRIYPRSPSLLSWESRFSIINL